MGIFCKVLEFSNRLPFLGIYRGFRACTLETESSRGLGSNLKLLPFVLLSTLWHWTHVDIGLRRLQNTSLAIFIFMPTISQLLRLACVLWVPIKMQRSIMLSIALSFVNCSAFHRLFEKSQSNGGLSESTSLGRKRYFLSDNVDILADRVDRVVLVLARRKLGASEIDSEL